jgi:hypothetical protein
MYAQFSINVKTHNRKGKLVRSFNRKTLTPEQRERNRKLRQLSGLGILGVTTGALLYPSLTFDKKAKNFAETIDKVDRKRMDDYGMKKVKSFDERLSDAAEADRNRKGNGRGLYLNDLEFDKSIANKGKLKPRLTNLHKIMNGSEDKVFPGLSQELKAISNSKDLTNGGMKYKKELIKSVGQKLKILKLMGRFNGTYLMADFARTKNAKDKKQRRRRILIGGLKAIAAGSIVPTLPMVGEMIESNIRKNSPRTQRIRRINAKIERRNKEVINRRVIKDIEAGTTKVYQDTFNELRNAGVSVDDSFMYAQTAANEYKNTMDAETLKQLHLINPKGLKNHIPINKSNLGRNIGIGLMGAITGAGLLTLANKINTARKRNVEKQRLRKLNKGK